MRHSILDLASAELAEAHERYEAHRPGLGLQFVQEVRAAYDRILARPTSWPMTSKRARRCRVQRFPYNILFYVSDDEILIVAIAHLRRNPTYWHDRVSEPG